MKLHKVQAHDRDKPTIPTRLKKDSHECMFCGLKYPKATKYYKHANLEHLAEVEDSWMPCFTCGVFFPDQKTVISHTERSTNCKTKSIVQPTVHKCEYCDEEFSSQHFLHMHVNQEHLHLVVETWLPCTFCEVYFPSEEVVQDHISSSHQPKNEVDSQGRISCSYCLYNTQSSHMYYKHVNREHRDEICQDWLECELCNIYLPTRNSLIMHELNAHKITNAPPGKFKCDYCPMAFANSSRFYSHANNLHQAEIADIWFKCNECNKFFPTEDKLKLHSGSMHQNGPAKKTYIPQNTRTITCNYCPRSFTKARPYYVHSNMYHKDEISNIWFKCPSCDDYRPTQDIIRKHNEYAHLTKHERLLQNQRAENQPSADFPMPLDVEIKTEDSEDEDGHFLDHQEQLPLRVNLTEDGMETNQPFQDDKTSSDESLDSLDETVNSFESSFNAYKNYSNNTSADSSYQIKEEPVDVNDKSLPLWKRYKPMINITCEICRRTFKRQDHYNRHKERMHTQTQSVNCELCQKSFKRVETLQKHVKTVHMKTDRPTCTLCEKNFADAFALTTHMQSVHGNMKHDCEVCGKSFSSKGYVKRHMDLVHFKSKSFECEQCGQSFSENHVLKRHISSVHLKQRNYECEMCGQTFSENQSLKRHIQSVHLKQRNHECNQCGRSFSESHVLKRHVLSVHLKQRNYSCEKCGQTFSENHVLKRHFLAVHGVDTYPAGKTPVLKRSSKSTIKPPSDFLTETEIAAMHSKTTNMHTEYHQSQNSPFLNGLVEPQHHSAFMPGGATYNN